MAECVLTGFQAVYGSEKLRFIFTNVPSLSTVARWLKAEYRWIVVYKYTERRKEVRCKCRYCHGDNDSDEQQG